MINSFIRLISKNDITINKEIKKEYNKLSNKLRTIDNKIIFELLSLTSYFTKNLTKSIFTFHGSCHYLPIKILPIFHRIKPNYLNQTLLSTNLMLLVSIYNVHILKNCEKILKKINFEPKNKLVKKIKNFAIPIISIIGANFLIFKASKINSNCFFHSYLNQLNTLISKLFLFDENNERTTIASLIPARQKPKIPEIKTKSAIVYATSYYISYIAITCLTSNPLMCYSVPNSFSYVTETISINYMNSFITDN